MTIEQFELLTPSEKRMAIAQDVIDNVEAEKFKVTAFYSYVAVSDDLLQDMPSESVQQNFDKLGNCHVCALGGCLLSLVKFKNQIIFSDLVDFSASEKVYDLLTDAFSFSQLELIEAAFEGNFNSSYLNLSAIDSVTQPTYYPKHKETLSKFFLENIDDSERLITIMQNIIDNKGEFVI